MGFDSNKRSVLMVVVFLEYIQPSDEYGAKGLSIGLLSPR